MENQTDPKQPSVDSFREQILSKISTNASKLRQIEQTIEQSQGEITRLVQKKSLDTTQLQKFQGDLTGFSKEEIRDTFISAMDSQQRLLLMRGQLEKLHEQKNNIATMNADLEEMLAFLNLSHEQLESRKSRSTNIEMLDMLITAQEAERQRLSRQMHDGPAQSLSNLIVQAEIATKLFDIDPSKARDELDKLKNSAMSTFQKIRLFVSEIRPMMLDDLGLVPTLRKHVAQVQETTGTPISLAVSGEERKLKTYLEVFIFRTAQELINASLKRNQAPSSDFQVNVLLKVTETDVNLSVEDNGRVFTTAELTAADGLGLNLIKERTELLSGDFFCDLDRNSGVEISIHIPVADFPD